MSNKAKFFLLLFFHTTILLSNDNSLFSKLEINTTSVDAWFKKNNNYGLKNEGIFIESIYNQRINDKIKLSIDILVSPNKLYYKDSFISYNFSDKSYLKIGKYYRDFSKYFNDSLSSGHLLVSNNAQPLNKIGYNSFKKFQKISFDFGLSHAILEKNDLYSSPPFIHEKYIYMNFNMGNNLYGIGFIHEAMWGGKINSDDGSQPKSFKDFLKVFIAADGPLVDGQPHANALGNHLGLWEFFFEKQLKSNTLKIYYQHLFEDTSGLRFHNRYDGLWGLEVDSKKNTILLEYLETTNQNINPPYVDDSYYNHWIYTDGWSYRGFSMGNPHINPLNVIPVSVLHVGSNFRFEDKSIIFLLSKKINFESSINSIITFESKKKNSFSLSIYNEKNKFGLSVGYQLVF